MKLERKTVSRLNEDDAREFARAVGGLVALGAIPQEARLKKDEQVGPDGAPDIHTAQYNYGRRLMLKVTTGEWLDAEGWHEILCWLDSVIDALNERATHEFWERMVSDTDTIANLLETGRANVRIVTDVRDRLAIAFPGTFATA